MPGQKTTKIAAGIGACALFAVSQVLGLSGRQNSVLVPLFIAVAALGALLSIANADFVRSQTNRNKTVLLSVAALVVTALGFTAWKWLRPTDLAQDVAKVVVESLKQGRLTPESRPPATPTASTPPISSPVPSGHSPSPGSARKRHSTALKPFSAESLAEYLRHEPQGCASVWDDGTVDAGALRLQIRIGLQMAGWTLHPGGTKMADPGWFPDHVTIETRVPQGENDPASAYGRSVRAALSRQGLDSVIRLLDAPDYSCLRIKVADRKP